MHPRGVGAVFWQRVGSGDEALARLFRRVVVDGALQVATEGNVVVGVAVHGEAVLRHQTIVVVGAVVAYRHLVAGRQSACRAQSKTLDDAVAVGKLKLRRRVRHRVVGHVDEGHEGKDVGAGLETPRTHQRKGPLQRRQRRGQTVDVVGVRLLRPLPRGCRDPVRVNVPVHPGHAGQPPLLGNGRRLHRGVLQLREHVR